MKFFLLSVLNFLVMGSTFLFLSTSIRISDSVIAANFILFGLAQNASSLFSDSGRTNLAFRQTLRNPNQKMEIYSNLLSARLKMNVPIQILTLLVFSIKEIGILEWLIFLILSTFVVFYSIGLSLVQAAESYSKIYLAQLLNVLGFVIATYFLSRTTEPSLLKITLYLISAWVPVNIYFSKLIFNLLSNSQKYTEVSEDKTNFSRILYANFVTLNFNAFILSIFSSDLLILYTVSSMPITMLMPISASLSTLTFHRFKVQVFETSKHQIFKALYFIPPLLLVSAISLPLLVHVLGMFFGAKHVYANVVLIQIFSAILSLFTGLFGNLYSVTLLSRLNKFIAYAQAITILIIGTAGALLNSVLIVALSDLIARGTGLFLAIRKSSRGGRTRYHAQTPIT